LVGIGSYSVCGINGRLGCNVLGGMFMKYYFPLMPRGDKITRLSKKTMPSFRGSLIIEDHASL